MENTLAGIRQRVLVDKLDDEEFDAGVVDRAINETQRDIFNQYELTFMEKIFSGTVPAGTTMFKMPDDVGLVQHRLVTGPDTQQRNIEIGQMDFRDFTRLYPVPTVNSVGPIYNWALYGNSMMLSRPTDQDYQLTMYYYRKPKTLTENTDTPDIPEEFNELLVLGAYIRILKRNEDNDIADDIQKDYDKMLNQLVSKYGFREANGPIVMKNGYRRRVGGRNTTRNGLVEKSY